MQTQQIYQVRNISDLKDMFIQSKNLFGNKEAFLVKTNDEYTGISYEKFFNDVSALGTALMNLGLKDKHIAVIGENRYEWCTTYLAVVNGTGVIVPLDKELPYNDLRNLIEQGKINAIVFSDKYSKDIQKIKSEVSSLEYLINMDIEIDSNNEISFKKLIEKGYELVKNGNTEFINREINPEKMAILLFTSGTTGYSKGVMLSHKNIVSDIMAVCSVLYLDSNDKVLSILPLHHTYECTCDFLLMIYNGCTIAFNEGLKYIVKNLQEIKPTLLILVPLILENMYKKIIMQTKKSLLTNISFKAGRTFSKLLGTIKIDLKRQIFSKIHQNLGGKVRLIISGAAAIDPVVSDGLGEFGIKILQGYGLTECSPIVTVNHEFRYKNSSIGFPLPGIDVKIVEPNEDGIGEIAVKGDNVMLGYYENPVETQSVLKNGWFYTGDLGYCDNEGFFYITGRKKNIIVTKNGKNIYPEELESMLNQSEYIKESLVKGTLNKNTNEIEVHADIYPDFEVLKQKLKKDNIQDSDIQDLIKSEIKLINKNIPLYKHIKHFSIRHEEFEKTTTKKIKRHGKNSK